MNIIRTNAINPINVLSHPKVLTRNNKPMQMQASKQNARSVMN